VAPASGTTQKKAPRQPIYWPRKLPSGAAMVAARALPPLSSPKARGTSLCGTRRITVAVDIDQKPPITTPSSARPTIRTAKLGAAATTTPETIISPVSPSSRGRRSMRRVTEAMNRLVTTAKIPEIEIAWPARPSLRCRLAATGVSRLTGMNSEAISADTHSVSARTAPQPPVRVGLRSPSGAVWILMDGLDSEVARRRRSSRDALRDFGRRI
jgi:hypothetical protein